MHWALLGRRWKRKRWNEEKDRQSSGKRRISHKSLRTVLATGKKRRPPYHRKPQWGEVKRNVIVSIASMVVWSYRPSIEQKQKHFPYQQCPFISWGICTHCFIPGEMGRAIDGIRVIPEDCNNIATVWLRSKDGVVKSWVLLWWRCLKTRGSRISWFLFSTIGVSNFASWWA